MRTHEYQAEEMLRTAGIPVLSGALPKHQHRHRRRLKSWADRSQLSKPRFTPGAEAKFFGISLLTGRPSSFALSKEADQIYEELETIRNKTSDGKSGKGFFDKIRGFFDWS